MSAELQPPFQPPPAPGQWRLALLVAAIAGLLVLGGILWLGNPFQEPVTPSPARPLPPMDAEAERYGRTIGFDSLELTRWQNFLGQTVIYLDGRILNPGERTIQALELTLEFQDLYGQTVLRETVRPVVGGRFSPTDPRSGPLAPGESREFRAAFEHLPADWNQAVPRIRVTGLLLD